MKMKKNDRELDRRDLLKKSFFGGLLGAFLPITVKKSCDTKIVACSVGKPFSIDELNNKAKDIKEVKWWQNPFYMTPEIGDEQCYVGPAIPIAYNVATSQWEEVIDEPKTIKSEPRFSIGDIVVCNEKMGDKIGGLCKGCIGKIVGIVSTMQYDKPIIYSYSVQFLSQTKIYSDPIFKTYFDSTYETKEHNYYYTDISEGKLTELAMEAPNERAWYAIGIAGPT